MRARLRHLWETLSTSYWFVPTIMLVLAAALAFLLLYVDRAIGVQEHLGWLYEGGADGAKTVLSTVAGSIITVAGVVFSITIVSLTQAASQFGPRLLRNFMRDRGNQIVLGTFVATFLYCILVLRTIHGELEAGPEFVPNASVTAAVMLAVVSVGVLIYYIHHVSFSLQAPSVVAAVRQDLEAVIDRLPEEQGGSGEFVSAAEHDGDDPAGGPDGDAAASVAATVEGYVQVIDIGGLIELAEKKNLLIRLKFRPGHYVIEQTPLADVWPRERCDAEVADRLNQAFICGDHSTPEQDVEYAVRQMVEIAVRALSPGINDPFTAINCIDALGSAVCRLARRGLPGPLRHDGAGVLRIIMPTTTFESVVDMAFNQIRQYGRDSVAVTVRLLEVITACAAQANGPQQRQVLLRHAQMIHRQIAAAVPEELDRADIRKRWEAAARALDNEQERLIAEKEPPAAAR